MAFSRLFGKNKKEVGATEHHQQEHEEHDEAAHAPVEHDPGIGRDLLLPHQHQSQRTRVTKPKLLHPLQGVPFTLSPR